MDKPVLPYKDDDLEENELDKGSEKETVFIIPETESVVTFKEIEDINYEKKRELLKKLKAKFLVNRS